MNLITVIHLQFGDKNLKSILRFFSDYFDQYVSEVGFKIIIVENNPNSSFLKKSNLVGTSGLHIIRGDNTFREFSGWTYGLRYLREELRISDSNIIFSNDTMLEHRAFDECMKKAFYLGFNDIFRSESPMMIGDVDSLPVAPPLFSFETNKYLSTYLFALNLNAVKRVHTLVSSDNICDYFHRQCNVVSVFNEVGKLNIDYINSIEYWLYKKSNQKKWYGHALLTIENFSAMKSKAISILLEHFLSDTLIKSGIGMVDAKNYLHRNFFQKIIFFASKKIYSLKWRLKKYCKAFNL